MKLDIPSELNNYLASLHQRGSTESDIKWTSSTTRLVYVHHKKGEYSPARQEPNVDDPVHLDEIMELVSNT